ncbi:uncharacterized protein MYCGRDRAFT_108514 [Zymoseptoria tritici IPO323]|uniref:Uncharacterized protein n=1 Tax=Zymoseptoria tritici (strain CBS 115943 / IPO323) TaxID=336722 RepID=F9X5M3_ZYMTI|nr:uncharacterized protein MYCGRDRAFT_108514 [Zymoseptoria tritici IPO323]EGP89507.1 hypothetical protein MYCGRDRAFT_108514 [Zymoseptoria tritici IPO323]
MPKKRSFNFKQLQGASSGKPSTDGNDGKPTVNERLGELRKIEGKDAARRKRELAENVNQSRPAQLLRFAYLLGIEHDPNPFEQSPSLLHLALKTAAEHWDLFDEDDLPALAAELPLRLRTRLLSYIGYYGPAISISVLESMLGGDEAVTQLDLAASIALMSEQEAPISILALTKT